LVRKQRAASIMMREADASNKKTRAGFKRRT
jgi:hypothetical protein